jgi:hypothetical protein
MTLSELKRGEYFTLKPIAEPSADQVFIKGWFDRRADKYDCERYNRKCRDGARRMLKSSTVVYTGFDF